MIKPIIYDKINIGDYVNYYYYSNYICMFVQQSKIIYKGPLYYNIINMYYYKPYATYRPQKEYDIIITKDEIYNNKQNKLLNSRCIVIEGELIFNQVGKKYWYNMDHNIANVDKQTAHNNIFLIDNNNYISELTLKDKIKKCI